MNTLMDLVPHNGIGPVRFGMYKAEVLAALGEKQTWEPWMGGNLNDSLYYPGIVLCFDEYDSHGPLAGGRVVEIELNASFPARLFGISLAELTPADVLRNVDPQQSLTTFRNGSLHIPSLDLQLWFTPEGHFDLVRFSA